MKYDHYETDANGWTVWIRPAQQGYKLSCCDCGLVHVLNFRVCDGHAEFQAKRANRSTAMVRREKLPKPVIANCIVCGKRFGVPPNQIEYAKYCSGKCRRRGPLGGRSALGGRARA